MAKAKAKKKKAVKRNRPTLDQQVTNLEKSLSAGEVEIAQELADGQSPFVLTLAYRYVRQRQRSVGPGGLGSRIETLLDHVPDDKRGEIEALLTAAKAASKEE